jgi:hypothetical protein
MMFIPPEILNLLILTATVIVAVAPIILLLLWFRDKKGGTLW